MTPNIPVTLIVRNSKSNVPVGGEVLLRWVPRQGDYLSHEPELGVAHLYRVIAVVFPTNPVSAHETFDVHVTDEGPLNLALEVALAQDCATTTITA